MTEENTLEGRADIIEEQAKKDPDVPIEFYLQVLGEDLDLSED